MSLTKTQVSYHDVNSLQNIKTAAKTDEKAGLRQAAEQFEAIFMSMLLSSMRKANSAFEAEGMMNSQTTEFYRDMHDSQLATDLAQKGALGLADLLVAQLDPTAGLNRAKPDNELNMPGAINLNPLPARPDNSKALNRSEFSTGVRQTLQAIADLPAGMPAAAKHNAASQKAEVDIKQPTDWQINSPQDFVRKLLPAAQQAAKALGLDPMAMIAQAALETGWGQRMIKTAKGENSFNLFGIKAHNNWQGESAVVDTLEFRGGIAQKEQARFRSYASPEQSLQDYASFISDNPRYQQALQVTAEPAAYFNELQTAGYATDPEYAKKIMAVYQSPTFDEVRAELNAAQDFNTGADE
ncbi:flagellar assembly peptidoglycan hydrolase FlgJ [Arsukibacterium indicum]|uniref:Peptidoglycan hydrolase FlgJ n=1 Tax=Arsukibacterium indicum TaxID=2848612 RepID=A0ABS6MGX0_9GAMM|nr:flagellar assembly peptidoglycan hydrolase FlgJ [Arsukibacterium indicum]MBV2127890.1 flagellar assembly peptidoglycan hydrolase FlgJ [Arsukibacterium indicum]